VGAGGVVLILIERNIFTATRQQGYIEVEMD